MSCVVRTSDFCPVMSRLLSECRRLWNPNRCPGLRLTPALIALSPVSSKGPDEARRCRPSIIFVNLQVHPPFHWHRGECAEPILSVGSNFFCDANQTIRHLGFHVADCSQG